MTSAEAALSKGKPVESFHVEHPRAGNAADPCFQCDTCTAACPWGVMDGDLGGVRRLIRHTQLDHVSGGAVESELIWRCTGCRACEALCPRCVPIVDLIFEQRRRSWAARRAPSGLANVLWGIQTEGNPLRQAPSARSAWAKGLELKGPQAGDEALLYIGCTASYDRRAQRVARALVKLLKAAGVSFGILGDEEPCCGESAKALGYPRYFEQIARAAIKKLEGAGNVVVLSPHCFEVMKSDYPAFGARFTVHHATEYIAGLLAQHRLKFDKAVEMTVTYHDPCLLARGRCGHVLDAPRAILEAIPGLTVVEMADSGAFTFCCGGGGGRAWMETAPEERFADVRVRQAEKTGATMLATACPVCIAHFEDSTKTLEHPLQIGDVVELAARALDGESS